MAYLRQLNFPEHTVNVQIDETKCLGPIDCGICAKNCPARVFVTYVKDRVKGEVSNNWGIVASNDVFCWGCETCIKGCPENAISISEVNKTF